VCGTICLIRPHRVDRYQELITQPNSETSKFSDGVLLNTLTRLIDDIDEKRSQLNLLRQARREEAESRSTVRREEAATPRSPARVHHSPSRHLFSLQRVLSPAALKKKTAALKVLRQYRELERDDNQ
jgi:hypothetical protein